MAVHTEINEATKADWEKHPESSTSAMNHEADFQVGFRRRLYVFLREHRSAAILLDAVGAPRAHCPSF